MTVTVNFKNKTPIYEQIINNIKEQVFTEALKPNQKLKSMRQLSRELGVNTNTIQKAFAELKRQGVIYSFAGQGAFVSDISEINNLVDIKREELLHDIEKMLIKAKKLDIKKFDIEKVIVKIYENSDLKIEFNTEVKTSEFFKQTI